MKVKILIPFMFSIFALMLQWNCNDKITDPQIKDPREYQWDVAVLGNATSGQTTMFSIWGSSSKDIYVCGANAIAGLGKMYHFDGKSWSPVSLQFGFFDLSQIIGFNSNDIWVAGLREFDDPSVPTALTDSALILHFDGAKWSQISCPLNVRGLKSVWGTSTKDLYFGSTNGTVLHLKNAQWSLDTLYLGLSVFRVGGDQSRLFALGNTFKGQSDDSVMYFTKTTDSWIRGDLQLRDHFFLNPRFGLFEIYSPASGKFFSASFGIFEWDGTQWQKVLKTDATIMALTGTGISNMIAAGEGTLGPLIYHWDGVSWITVELPGVLLSKNTGITGVWTNGVETFAVANDGSQSYVIHGK